MTTGRVGIDKHLTATALRPGSVIGCPVDGITNVVSSVDDIARGEVAGYNARVLGNHRQLFPRLSREDYERLMLTRLPEEHGALEEMLGALRCLSKSACDSFLATRKMVRQTMHDGSERLIVVARLPDAMNEVDVVDVEREEGVDPFDTEEMELPTAEQLAQRVKSRVYTLAQIFTDESVLAKYQLGLRATETGKRLAATDPGAAAVLFQSMMNSSQDVIRVEVRAGEFSRDRTQARNTIRQFCRDAPRTDVAVESLVMMDKLVMFGPGGEHDWHVMGPLKYASEMSFLYWLINSEGYVHPTLLLGMELVLLGIDVNDGVTSQEPEIEYHASLGSMSPMTGGLSEEALSLMSLDTRMALDSVRKRLHPIMSEDGHQLATSVRATDKCILVNSHVMDTNDGCTVNGDRIYAKSQLSRDLWAATSLSTGQITPWLLREPVVGELAIVCYLVDGELCCSAPLKITSVDASCVLSMLDDSVTHGMSGGALVAIEDLALLGVHSASTRTNLISYRFGEKQFAELLESDSATSFSRRGDVDGFAEKASLHFQRRGLWQVLVAAINTLEPVFIGSMHVGTAVHNGNYLYTTCNAEEQLRLGKDKRVATFESVGEHYYRTPALDHKAPVYRRAPNYYEKVFVIGWDTEEYMSTETVVLHVAPNAHSFVLRDIPGVDKPMLGGIVMGWDGAVLGCCGMLSMTTAAGLGYPCWPLAREELPVPTSPRSVLSIAFPFLNIVAWSDDILEEVFVHSSIGRYRGGGRFNAGMKPLANIGDNAAKMELYKSLRDEGVPHSQWSGVMQKLQSNATFAESAWRLGYARALVVGSGVSMARTAKAYADLTEAIIGAAVLVERPEVVTMLCSTMGVLYSARLAGDVVMDDVESPPQLSTPKR